MVQPATMEVISVTSSPEMSVDVRVSALGTKKNTTPFSVAREEISTSSSFSFLRVKFGRVSPMSIVLSSSIYAQLQSGKVSSQLT